MTDVISTGGADQHRSRRKASLPARARRHRLGRTCGAAFVIGALAFGVGAATVGLPAGMTPSAQAYVNALGTGQGYDFWDSQGVGHWLGANKAPDGGRLMWCIEFGPVPIGSTAQFGDVRDLVASDQRSDVDASLSLNPAQFGWLFLTYESTDTADTRAALSVLAHANYDVSKTAPTVLAEIRQKLPAVWAKAQALAAEARRSTPQSYTVDYTNPDAKRTGTIHNIQAYDADGNPIAGVPVTAKLNGPAVFDATGTNTWTGTTQSSPMTLNWTATGTATVSYQLDYQVPKYTMVRYGNNGSVQDMLRPGKEAGDPEVIPETGELTARYDFQPIATSNVAEADSKIVDAEAGVIRDVIHVKADPSYTQSPDWMYDAATGNLVPVVFEGTAYYTGDLPAAESATVPADAKVVGTTKVIATGPGDYTAEIKTDLSPDVITWVWKVAKADQGDYASYVAKDWSDAFGLGDETTSVRDTVEIDSTIASNVTKRGTYLVDSLYIDGFDEDHGDFEGDTRVGMNADVDDMTQALYFFPQDLEVKDANLSKATKIAEVKVPAKNGYVDRVGTNKFKMLDGNPAGTYVFITSFPGDDRTAPYTSSAEDENEQIVVGPNPPEIKTTATDKADGDKTLPSTGDVTITDKVCQVKDKGLEVGKTYVLTATAMDKETGEAILDPDGKPYTGTAEFTPTSEEDCGLVDVTIPASALWGKTIVMFEKVTLDGRTVALHTDINDEGQTVEGGDNPGLGTTLTDKADGDHEVAPGPVELVDEVCPKLEGTFEVGKTYTVTGTLMDKATGEPVTGKDGKEVASTAEFTPTAADECATVTFSFDTSDLNGHDVVAFEKAFDANGALVASHEDINDEGQTVKVREVPEVPGLAKTGANAALVATLVLTAGTLMAAGGGALVVRRRKATAHE